MIGSAELRVSQSIFILFHLIPSNTLLTYLLDCSLTHSLTYFNTGCIALNNEHAIDRGWHVAGLSRCIELKNEHAIDWFSYHRCIKFEMSNDQSQLIFGSISVLQARDAVPLTVIFVISCIALILKVLCTLDRVTAKNKNSLSYICLSSILIV